MVLPGAIAHHSHWHRVSLVIRKCEESSGKGLDAQGLKIIATYVFAQQRLGLPSMAAVTHAKNVRLCLERSDLLELRSRAAQTLIKVIRKDAPFTLKVVRIAASLPGPDAVEAPGIGDGKRLQHHGVNQREDSRGGADTEP